MLLGKKYEGFGIDELLKTAKNANQNDLEARLLSY